MFSIKLQKEIEENYEKALSHVVGIEKVLREKMGTCEGFTVLLLKYLYGTMPVSDMVSYPFETFLEYAGHGAFLWENGPFKDAISEEQFLQDVLFHRINTEEITPCRSFFYEQIAEAIHGMSASEAILEINYWCAKEATYRSTDDRTSSPMSVFLNAIGRCGEESTFTVSALRSVGIPARQVYAHRWAHCDDNHAWVEVWCDGSWHFIGACEPEEILDKGWFTNASSRAMMVHSRIFGGQQADGMVIEQKDMTACVNQLSRYAKTIPIVISVTNDHGQPICGAIVTFEILNYAHLVPIATLITDETGCVQLITGLGSLWITASFQDMYAKQCIDTRMQAAVAFILNGSGSICEEDWEDFDMTAPVDTPVNKNQPTKQQKEAGQIKYEAAVKKRAEKTAAFYQEDSDTALYLSRGNAHEIESFYESAGEHRLKAALLSQLSEKDHRDCKANILLEHLQFASVWETHYEKDIFEKYILNPRVSIEPMTAYRSFIDSYFSDEEKNSFMKEPALLWEWIKTHIQSHSLREYEELITAPAGALQYGIASELSQKILFVAICRSIGVAARFRQEDASVEYYMHGTFRNVEESEEKTAHICVGSGDDTQWIYMQNWTIARKQGNCYQTFALPEGMQGNVEIDVVPGEYRVITTNRLPNGNQFAKYLSFFIQQGETKNIPLLLRKASLAEMLEELPITDFMLEDHNGNAISAAEEAKQQDCLLIWLEESKEPTEHILNELFDRKDEFQKVQGKIIFIVRTGNALSDPTISRTLQAIPQIEVLYDKTFENVNTLGRRMYVDPEKLPLIIVTKAGLTGIYAASGYNVGTGDMLLRVLNRNEWE